MKYSNKIFLLTVAFSVAAATVQAFPWTRDFYDQKSHKAQEGTILSEPDGAVTVNGKNYMLDDDQDAGRKEASKISNPISPNGENIAKGKAAYDRYCFVCHGNGAAGGEGPVGKKFEANIMAPTPLVEDYVQSKTDGEIFYIITKGGRIAMPSYGDLVPEEDRWHIINYIKNELKSGGGN